MNTEVKNKGKILSDLGIEELQKNVS